MRFELSETLINDILFAMEDQAQEFLLDTHEGILIPRDILFEVIDLDGGDRYIPLPEWDAADGFRLMERFAGGCKNQPVQDQLRGALRQGKGSFRAFKEALKDRPETEQQWFNFKEKELRRRLNDWYTSLRETWSLGRTGMQAKAAGSPPLANFTFRPSTEADREAAARLHRLCAGGKPDILAADEAALLTSPLSFTAETRCGEFAGYITARQKGEGLYISALEVIPQYRRLGIGSALLEALLETTRQRPRDRGKASWIYLELPVEFERFSRVLSQRGFQPGAVRYALYTGGKAD
jgi:ribosomal protein S18 acetylase RimI-like enzyme